MTNPTEIATTYFDAWRAGDFDTLGSVLAGEVTFKGPLAEAVGAEQCLKGLEGLSRITTDIVVQRMLADDHDVITWFDLHTTVAPPFPVANWSHVEEGLITRVRVTFDPRPMLG